ncbi:hypothetical protein [Promicromonospora sp. NPDC059942]|uniref:hypothetical protein n=1 Tax=Promicromonospora sp. NPDC059942 TaxID=3347009 RepID=UPI0036572A7A
MPAASADRSVVTTPRTPVLEVVAAAVVAPVVVTAVVWTFVSAWRREASGCVEYSGGDSDCPGG